jgi:hypothetical protein
LPPDRGCSTLPRPEQAYEAIRREFRHGNLDDALQHADLEFQKYSGKDGYWAWRFRTLKAHILIFRGSYNESLQLLAPELPTALAHTDVAVRRKLIQGIAHDNTQRYDESLQDLTEAAQLAQSYQPELIGDVAQARGNLEIDHCSGRIFRRSRQWRFDALRPPCCASTLTRHFSGTVPPCKNPRKSECNPRLPRFSVTWAGIIP